VGVCIINVYMLQVPIREEERGEERGRGGLRKSAKGEKGEKREKEESEERRETKGERRAKVMRNG
jgi:hypothetical protein